ncbi:RHS repeat-associated core domain-containing protein, partial [Maricaulis salignorans]
TGHITDTDTGMVYMQARYYDPAIGRFLSGDPVGFAQGGPGYFNRYAYVGNNPLNATDPSGETMMPPDATDPDGIAREQEYFEAGREIGEGIAQLPSIADRALGDGVLYAGAEGSGYLGWGKDGTYNGENGAEGEYGWAFDGATNEFVEFAAHSNPKDGTPDTVGGDLGANLNFGWARNISVLTSPGSSMSVDLGVVSISLRIGDQTGEMVGMEVGPGIGVGGGLTRSDGAELTRVNPNRGH